MSKMGPEARGRLTGEAELIKRHKAEHARLLNKHGRIGAIVKLVEKHKNEYGALVKAARTRFEAEQAA